MQNIRINRRNWVQNVFITFCFIFIVFAFFNLQSHRRELFIVRKVLENATAKEEVPIPTETETESKLDLPQLLPNITSNDPIEQSKNLESQLVLGEKDHGEYEILDEITTTNTGPDPLIPLDIQHKVRRETGCKDVNYKFEKHLNGDYLLLKNYVKADHGVIGCAAGVTLATHSEYTYLDNLIPLLQRWTNPISIAVQAEGFDYLATIESIQYLRNCLPESNLVRSFVTFHLFFHYKHMSKEMKTPADVLNTTFDCNASPPYKRYKRSEFYKTRHNITYPINVGRNLARTAALTHFVFVSDSELYPSPDLPLKFLRMIANNEGIIQQATKPKVFTLPIFEMNAAYNAPWSKTELLKLKQARKLFRFQKDLCRLCHRLPMEKEWEETAETDELDVFTVGKRNGKYSFWEPFYIGTKNDPIYDERITWEGRRDKFAQAFAMCLLDYEFHILNNAFVVHRPGVRKFDLEDEKRRRHWIVANNHILEQHAYIELEKFYGKRESCDRSLLKFANTQCVRIILELVSYPSEHLLKFCII